MQLVRRAVACIAIVLCIAPEGVRAQDALVLSGGGSRGLAHAGVLLALDSLGYDPDIVVGTSMGAVVGALYAAGYDAAAVRDRLAGVQWAELFSPTLIVAGPARDARAPSIALDLDLSGRRVGRGLVGQWRINRALVRLLFDAEARSRGDFDRLPRRYRAVATDLRTGDAVELGSGDLARATRASMAVPGLFAPVAWDGLVLVDGGIADNLAIATARAMGATHVIASDVSRPPAEIHSQAPFAVIGRALDLMQENMHRDAIPPDVLLLPPIDPAVTGAVFPRNPSGLFRIGFAVASNSLPPAPLHLRGEARSIPAPPATFSALEIEAPDSALARLARHVFAPVIAQPYDVERVTSAMDRLYSTGLFEGVWPRVADGSTPDPDLVVRLEAPPPLSLSAAANYDNDRGGRAWLSLDRYTPLVGRPGTMSVAASLGGLERWGALSARVHALSRTPLAWSAGAYVNEYDVRFFPEDAVGATQVLRAGGWLALELPRILRDRLTTATVRGEWVNVEGGGSGFSAGPRLRYTAGAADPGVVGVPVLVEAERRWGDATYSRVALAGSSIHATRGLQVAVLADLRAVSADAPPDVRPALGDGHAMPGFRWGEERGAARAVAGIDAAQDLLSGYARLRLRAGSVAPAWDEWDGTEWRIGAQIGGVWQTPVGALELAYGLNSRGDGRFDVNVGRDF